MIHLSYMRFCVLFALLKKIPVLTYYDLAGNYDYPFKLENMVQN